MEASSISDHIERILQSQTFASKKQLRKLLEVLSKNLDSQELLTADLIIRDLCLGETRTKRPVAVAAKMNRLRHALKSRYAKGAKTTL
jgi:hypothetical protein